MGRLKAVRLFSGTTVRLFIVFCALIVGFFLYANTSRIDQPSSSELAAYLKNNRLQVGTRTVNDFEQVYFLFNNQRVYVTDGSASRNLPVASGKYIVWTETPYQQSSSLVVLYDVLSRVKTQLTASGTSMRPKLDTNRVVWEDWNGSQAQIYYYDGLIATQLSKDYPSVRPDIRGNQIIYAQELAPNNWQTILYDTNTKQSTVVVAGTQAQAGWPRFEGDKITANNPIY